MSSTTDRFAHHTLETAPEGSRAVLREQQKKFGFVASPLALMATSPAVLRAAVDTLHAFENTSLSRAEREVLAFTVAHENECHYCIALHSAVGRGIPEIAPELERLRAGGPPRDGRLAALAAFVRSVMAHRGEVPAAGWEPFLAAGFTTEQALEVVLGVAAYTLTTFANRLTGAPLDPPFERFRWTRTATAASAASLPASPL